MKDIQKQIAKQQRRASISKENKIILRGILRRQTGIRRQWRFKYATTGN